jgi:hypothetical protein
VVTDETELEGTEGGVAEGGWGETWAKEGEGSWLSIEKASWAAVLATKRAKGTDVSELSRGSKDSKVSGSGEGEHVHCNESENVAKATDLLGDSVCEVSLVSEPSKGELEEGVKSKEPGIGCKCGAGKTRGVCEDELAKLEEGAEGFAGLLVNLPVIWSW